MHTTENGGSTTEEGSGGRDGFQRTHAESGSGREVAGRNKTPETTEKEMSSGSWKNKNKSQAIHRDYTSPTWELPKWVTV